MNPTGIDSHLLQTLEPTHAAKHGGERRQTKLSAEQRAQQSTLAEQCQVQGSAGNTGTPHTLNNRTAFMLASARLVAAEMWQLPSASLLFISYKMFPCPPPQLAIPRSEEC